MVAKPCERERAQLVALAMADRHHRPLGPDGGAHPAGLDFDEDERRTVEGDEVDLSTHGRGPLVSRHDAHPAPLEGIGHQRLPGAPKALAGPRHGADRTGGRRARGAPIVK